MNVTHILLRSLMAQRFPMPPGARLLVADAELPAHIRTRVLGGDLVGFTWRAWTVGAETTFMAVKRLFGRSPAARREVLWVVAIWPGGDDRRRWEHRGGGAWELTVQGAGAEESDNAGDLSPRSAPASRSA